MKKMSKAQMGMEKKEMAFMKKAGAPKKMVQHEEKEMMSQGMKCGGMVKKYAAGGTVRGAGAAMRGKTTAKIC